MKKYTYYRFHQKFGFGFKHGGKDYTFVRNNTNNEWFAVYRGQSVSKRDNKKNYHSDKAGQKDFLDAIKNKVWIPYTRRPRQVLP